MSTIQDIIKQMEEWPVSLLLVVVLNFVGWGIKKSETIPNKIIPLVLMLLGAGIYCSVGDISSLSFTARNPVVILALYGCLLGVIAWLAHNLIWRAVIKKFPQIQNGDSETQIFKKPTDQDPKQ